MNNKCWYKLNVGDTKHALREDWVFPTVEGNFGIWDLSATKIFNKEWLSYLSQVGLDIKYVMLFYRGPGFNRTTAHIDVYPPGTPPVQFLPGAFNYVLQGKGSEMVWYDTPAEPKEVMFTKAKTPYLEWPILQLEEKDRTEIGEELVLVRTDVPHTVAMGNEGRWCISGRFDNMGSVTWDEMVSRVESLNLLIER